MNDFFSERELGKKDLSSEEITLGMYNTIIAIFSKYKLGLSKEFPDYCDDFDNIICGVNESMMKSMIIGYIPELEDKLYKLEDEDDLPTKYSILDFVEFIYSKLVDYTEYEYHSYMKHNHLSFSEDNELKNTYLKEINRLFERNGITFYLDSDGMIKRHLPLELDTLLNNMIINTSDSRLNELINLAITKIKMPNQQDRIYALEKLWDGFERMKTFYSEKKKKSVEQLIQEVAGTTQDFNKVLDDEFRALTKLGNEYQIRHFEKDKLQIHSSKKIDYLFYRMISLVNLCISSINIF